MVGGSRRASTSGVMGCLHVVATWPCTQRALPAPAARAAPLRGAPSSCRRRWCRAAGQMTRLIRSPPAPARLHPAPAERVGGWAGEWVVSGRSHSRRLLASQHLHDHSRWRQWGWSGVAAGRAGALFQCSEGKSSPPPGAHPNPLQAPPTSLATSSLRSRSQGEGSSCSRGALTSSRWLLGGGGRVEPRVWWVQRTRERIQ